MSILTDPPFAANPPVKMNINAKTLGLVLAIIGALAILFDVIGLIGDLAFCGGINSLYGTCGLPIIRLLGHVVSLAAAALFTIGAYRMYQGNAQGKEWVIYGLILRFVAAVLVLIGEYAAYSSLIGLGVGGVAIFGLVFSAIILFIVYYLVVVSRFPGEAGSYAPPAAGSWGGGPSAPPPPPV